MILFMANMRKKKAMSPIKTYSELILLPTFEERFNYLKCYSNIGIETFGHGRYLNQVLYNCSDWKHVWREVVIRDNNCDLGLEGYEIIRDPRDKSNNYVTMVHHMNPITIEQVLDRDPVIFDPEYLITTKGLTHRLLHYGSKGNMPPHKVIVRERDDTCPWK